MTDWGNPADCGTSLFAISLNGRKLANPFGFMDRLQDLWAGGWCDTPLQGDFLRCRVNDTQGDEDEAWAECWIIQSVYGIDIDIDELRRWDRPCQACLRRDYARQFSYWEMLPWIQRELWQFPIRSRLLFASLRMMHDVMIQAFWWPFFKAIRVATTVSYTTLVKDLQIEPVSTQAPDLQQHLGRYGKIDRM